MALVGTHQDLVQGAVVGLIAVVGAGHHSALDGFVGMAVHRAGLLSFGSGVVCPGAASSFQKSNQAAISQFFETWAFRIENFPGHIAFSREI